MRAAVCAAVAACIVAQERVIPIAATCSTSSGCTAAFNAAFAACAGATSCAITLDAGGEYLFTGNVFATLVEVVGQSNVSLQGNGATLLMADIANLLYFTQCHNVTLSDFFVDMVRLPFTYGQVTASNATWSTVAFNSTEYLFDPQTVGAYPWLLGAQGIMSFDPVNMRPANNALDVYALDASIPIASPTISPASGTGTFAIQYAIPVGTWAIVRHQTYGYNAVSVTSSHDITLSNVTLYATAGMGVVSSNITNVLLDGVNILRKGSRPMSITADGAHFTSCRGGDVVLRDCVFEGQGDDGLNVPSLYVDVEAIISPTSIQIGKDGQVQAPVMLPGDTLVFMNRSSFVTWGTSAVASIGPNNTVILATPMPVQTRQWDLVLNRNTTPASVLLEGNTFRNNRARGTLLKAHNVLVRNNSYLYNSGPAAQAQPDGCHWLEGFTTQNWTFVDNLVVGANYGPAKSLGDVWLSNCVPQYVNGVPSANGGYVEVDTPMHFNITITGNRFVQNQNESAVSLFAVGGATVANNTVTYAPGTRPAADFECVGCTGTEAAGNNCGGGACVIVGF